MFDLQKKQEDLRFRYSLPDIFQTNGEAPFVEFVFCPTFHMKDGYVKARRFVEIAQQAQNGAFQKKAQAPDADASVIAEEQAELTQRLSDNWQSLYIDHALTGWSTNLLNNGKPVDCTKETLKALRDMRIAHFGQALAQAINELMQVELKPIERVN